MFAKLLKPQVDLSSLLLRWGLAAVFIVHGVFKVDQNSALMEDLSFTTQLLVGWTELVCGLALAVGLFSRIAALGLIPLQTGAILLTTGKYALRGMLLTPAGADFTQVGPEFNLVLIAMCLAVFLLGSGSVSLDHFLLALWRRRRARPAPPLVPLSPAESATSAVVAVSQP